jgi:hypothetical protein
VIQTLRPAGAPRPRSLLGPAPDHDDDVWLLAADEVMLRLTYVEPAPFSFTPSLRLSAGWGVAGPVGRRADLSDLLAGVRIKE